MSVYIQVSHSGQDKFFKKFLSGRSNWNSTTQKSWRSSQRFYQKKKKKVNKILLLVYITQSLYWQTMELFLSWEKFIHLVPRHPCHHYFWLRRQFEKKNNFTCKAFKTGFTNSTNEEITQISAHISFRKFLLDIESC